MSTDAVRTQLVRGTDLTGTRESLYGEVLNLRLAAYRSVGKVPATFTAGDMADRYDACSVHVIAHAGGIVVGAVRVFLPISGGPVLQHEEWMALPKTLPCSPCELAEPFKACTHPNRRGSGLLLTLIGEVVSLTLSAGRRWILFSATADLAAAYKRIGGDCVTSLGRTYLHPVIGVPHELLLADAVMFAPRLTGPGDRVAHDEAEAA
jgi:hypothetical protein